MMNGKRGFPYARLAGVVLSALLFCTVSNADNFSLFTGKTSGNINFVGIKTGGEIVDFLHFQIEGFKYLAEDENLLSSEQKENRSDFLGVSVNFALKIPIHLIPYLDSLDFIQPYIVQGIGYGWENLSREYLEEPNPVNNKTGLTSKMMRFTSFGMGLTLVLSPSVGILLDSRSIRLSAHEGMAIGARSFNRFSIGISFGSYQTIEKNRIRN